MKGPLGIFQYPVCRKTQKNERGTLWGKIYFSENNSRKDKKLKGGPFDLVRLSMFRGKLFGSVPWANRSNIKFLEVLVELFCSLQVYRKKENILKTLTKSHDYSRRFSLEKRRLKLESAFHCF